MIASSLREKKITMLINLMIFSEKLILMVICSWTRLKCQFSSRKCLLKREPTQIAANLPIAKLTLLKINKKLIRLSNRLSI
jgi:hypothetical protein